MTETIVLGLDGANWALLKPWLEEERLPNIEALRSEGVVADMESCLPPVTCPNWRCYSTGKNPGKLGVFWWERIDTDRRTLTTPDSRSFKSANYWDYLNEQGRTAGILNLPMTYPPFEVDRFLVAGGQEASRTITPIRLTWVRVSTTKDTHFIPTSQLPGKTIATKPMISLT
ncbi:alkaline phosphatase family protein [Saliphagus sp. GCM10025308]